MNNIITRLETATGPDRELDRDIVFEIFPPDRKAVFNGVRHVSTMTGANGDPWFTPLESRGDCSWYTRSIDDALTLLPMGWGWCIRTGNPNGDAQGCMKPYAHIYASETEQGRYQGYADTPALAIIIAALKARGL